MKFRRPQQRYGDTPEPVTPYQRAAQIWDDRLGAARVQAKNWRLMAFGSLVLATGLAASVVWQGTQSRVTPYVVEVDKLGEVRAVGPAVDSYRPSDAQIAWHLARFVGDVRAISTDPVLLRQNWLEAYDFATDRAAIFLNDFARANDPFKAVGVRSVQVQVTSVVRASDNSFQVKWIERPYQQGSPLGTERWTAILGIVTESPRTAESLRKNPLGLYVNAIAWSRELEVSATPETRID
jgi:type IV secretory pathway TrbF-like protein